MRNIKPENKSAEEVLAWCNEVRAILGKKPRKTFEAGIPNSECACVVARTVGGNVLIGTSDSWDGPWYESVDFEANYQDFDVPIHVWDFMHMFDFGELPCYAVEGTLDMVRDLSEIEVDEDEGRAVGPPELIKEIAAKAAAAK